MTNLRRFAAVARATRVLAAGFAAAAVMGGCSPDSAVPTLTAPTPLPATMAPANDDPAPSTPAAEAGTAAQQVSFSAPSNGAGGNEPAAPTPREGFTAGPQSAAEEEEEEEEAR
ncbi:MAG: hypothetical protein OXC11_02175 [Rhodospirillales bacterium]|nr:hypothetical protein [Rhodospirillales bacterium]